MFLVNAFYFYSRSEVLNSEEINIKTIQKLPQHLLDQNFPFWNVKLSRQTSCDFLAKLPPTEKKQIQKNHVVYVQKTKSERNLDLRKM